MRTLFLTLALAAVPVAATAQDLSNGADNFYRSDRLTTERVSFDNQYRMKVAGNLFLPKDRKPGVRYPAIIVGHPMGAVKEQSSNLYAQKLAEQGFVTLAIDVSYWGESDGAPGHLVAPEIYTDDFSAAVDFLSTQGAVDPARIGVLGICGSGSFVISAAKIDPRMKAIATVSMYDMGAAVRDGLNKSTTPEQRKGIIQSAIEQRFREFTGGEIVYVPGTVNELDAGTPAVQREFYDFYRTSRGAYTPKGQRAELTTKPMLSSIAKFMNFYPFNDIATISPRPMLFIAGDQAHSKEFSEEAFRLAGQPKALHWVKGAGHVDLYDRTDLIPFDALASFYREHLE